MSLEQMLLGTCLRPLDTLERGYICSENVTYGSNRGGRGWCQGLRVSLCGVFSHTWSRDRDRRGIIYVPFRGWNSNGKYAWLITNRSRLGFPPLDATSFSSSRTISAQTRSTSLSNDRSLAFTNRNCPREHTLLQCAIVCSAATAFLPTIYIRKPLPWSPCVAARARMVYSPMPDVPPTKTATRGWDWTSAVLLARTAGRATMTVKNTTRRMQTKPIHEGE